MMDELQQVYLIAIFPDRASLERAARALDDGRHPIQHMAVLGADEAQASATAEALNVDTDLEHDIELDDAQETQLAWHRENDDRPLLAVRVPAAAGRDVRLELTKMGAEMLTAPTISEQANDVVFDPGMGADDPDLPPNHDRIYAPN